MFCYVGFCILFFVVYFSFSVIVLSVYFSIYECPFIIFRLTLTFRNFYSRKQTYDVQYNIYAVKREQRDYVTDMYVLCDEIFP